jgi:hypothetical protein
MKRRLATAIVDRASIESPSPVPWVLFCQGLARNSCSKLSRSSAISGSGSRKG